MASRTRTTVAAVATRYESFVPCFGSDRKKADPLASAQVEREPPALVDNASVPTQESTAMASAQTRRLILTTVVLADNRPVASPTRRSNLVTNRSLSVRLSNPAPTACVHAHRTNRRSVSQRACASTPLRTITIAAAAEARLVQSGNPAVL